jgi:hypothetical protein
VDPTTQSRGINQALFNCILSNFKWVAFLDIHKALPACSPIFPFNTQVPTLGCFPHLFVAPMLDGHISRFNGVTIRLVVNNAFHQVVLSVFNVTLCIHILCNFIGGIHILCNYIGGIFITAATRKLNLISTGFQH